MGGGDLFVRVQFSRNIYDTVVSTLYTTAGTSTVAVDDGIGELARGVALSI